jgi:hypothetical protein
MRVTRDSQHSVRGAGRSVSNTPAAPPIRTTVAVFASLLAAASAVLLLPVRAAQQPAASPQPTQATQATQAARQFVLVDVTFTYTKADADSSAPSKSHFYVKAAPALNPDRPRDWTSPVDFRHGTVHIRTEVMQRPEGGEPTQWSLCYIPNKGVGNGYGCTGVSPYTAVGVYEKDVPMDSFWENRSILWEQGIRQVDIVMKDKDGNKVHTRPDPEKFLPTKVRIIMVQVAAGAKYDPALVPGLAPAPAPGPSAGE